MGTFAKFNSAANAAAKACVEDCLAALDTVGGKVSKFKSDADSNADNWLSKVKVNGPYDVKDGTYDDDNDSTTPEVDKYVSRYNSNFDSENQTSYDKAKTKGQQVCKDDYITPYKSYAADFSDSWDTLKGTLSEKLGKINTVLDLIQAAADTFDGSAASISAILEQMEAAGLADNVEVMVDANGNEIVYYNLYDENGALIGQFTVAEMVNSFYTYAGSAMSGAIATSTFGSTMIDGWDEMTPEEQAAAMDNLLNNQVAGIGNNVYQLMGQGFMSVAAEDDIKGMYESVFGDGTYANLTDTYTSLITNQNEEGYSENADKINSYWLNETNGLLAGGAAIAAGSAYTLGDNAYSDSNVTEAKDRLDQHANKKAEEKEETEETEEEETKETEEETEDTGEKTEEKEDNGSGDGTGTGSGNGSGNGSGWGSGSGDGSGSGSGSEDTPEDEGVTKEETGGTTPETDKRFDKVTEKVIPDAQAEVKTTNEDVDDMANEKFFDDYEGEALTERRQADIEAFENLYNRENKEELLDMFEDMGYSKDEAIALVNNGELGLQAYLLNSQNKEMADIANNFADEMGMTDFDTSYDDTPDYTDFTDGDAQVALSDVSTDKAVVEAKTNYDNAKTTYVDSVTKANESIAAAQQAKTDLDALRTEIETKSGTDTTKWTDAQIEQYNSAAKAYNTAVTQANEDVAAAEAAKVTYSETKEAYEEAKNEFYDQIRRDVQESNGSISAGEELIDTSANQTQSQVDAEAAANQEQNNNNTSDGVQNTDNVVDTGTSDETDNSSGSDEDVMKDFLGL